jgi:hypothetical protein
MADYGHVVAWKGIRQGREMKALEVWGDTLEFYEKARANGQIDSYDTVLIEPSGDGLPIGMLTVWGTEEQVDAFVRDEARVRLQTRAGFVTDGLGVARCARGQAVADGVGQFTEIASGF